MSVSKAMVPRLDPTLHQHSPKELAYRTRKNIEFWKDIDAIKYWKYIDAGGLISRLWNAKSMNNFWKAPVFEKSFLFQWEQTDLSYLYTVL